MDNIKSFINTADLHILRELEDFVKNKIIEKENSTNVKDYVSAKKEFITDLGGVEYQSILSDLDLLKLKKPHKKDIQTAWLTLNNEPYTVDHLISTNFNFYELALSDYFYESNFYDFHIKNFH